MKKVTNMGKVEEKVSLVKVERNEEHAAVLYELLKRRRHKISHKVLPSFDEHKSFVIDHPYRIWLLIESAEGYVGSIYAYKNNGIGVSVTPGNERFIRSAISLFLASNKPLKPIKSVRSAEFGVYAAPSDKKLISVLQSMGAHFVQVTYLFAA